MAETLTRLWPEGASPDYVDARAELLRAEAALRDERERVAAMRRRLPPGPAMDQYEFTEGPRDFGSADPSTYTTTRLDELVPADRPLVVYHMMFGPDDDEACPMCSTWVDGLHGVAHHLGRRVEFAVIAKATLDKLRAWALRRGWNGLRLLSSGNTSFNLDLGVEADGGAQEPGISVFTKDDDGAVRHRYTMQADLGIPGVQGADQRGVDLYSPVWHVLDLLPEGRGSWYPDNSYPGATRG